MSDRKRDKKQTLLAEARKKMILSSTRIKELWTSEEVEMMKELVTAVLRILFHQITRSTGSGHFPAELVGSLLAFDPWTSAKWAYTTTTYLLFTGSKIEG